MDTAHPTALLFADVKRAAACLLPAVAVLGLYAYLNWNVIGQPPYYDEMWKLDLVVPHGTVERYFTHDTPIPIGWLYLNKALLFFTPDNFAVIRSFGPLWVALAMALLVWRLSPASHIHWPVVAGATFLATCLPARGGVGVKPAGPSEKSS